MLPLSPTNASLEQPLHNAGVFRLQRNPRPKSALYLSYKVTYFDIRKHREGSHVILRASPG